MKKLACLIVSTGLIAACSVQTPRVLPQDNYLIDTQLGLMCHVYECYYLSLIGPSWQEDEIARALTLPSGVYRWGAGEFVTHLTNPPNNLYPVEQLSATEFRLPRNQATRIAFDALEQEDLQLYRIGGDSHSY